MAWVRWAGWGVVWVYFAAMVILFSVRFYWDMRYGKEEIRAYFLDKLERMAAGEKDSSPWAIGGVDDGGKRMGVGVP